MQRAESERVTTQEAMQIAGFINRSTFLKCIRARRIPSFKGRSNKKMYSRAKMLELARDRAAAEKRRMMGRNGRLDPLNEPATTGEVHAQAFELFEQRTPLHEVVNSLKLPAEVVVDLFEKWWKLGQVTEQWLRPPPAAPAVPQPDAPQPIAFAGRAPSSNTAEAIEAARAAREAALKSIAQATEPKP